MSSSDPSLPKTPTVPPIQELQDSIATLEQAVKEYIP
jgi:hypothetical protein